MYYKPAVTFEEALKEMKRVGTANATGNAYRAMYAQVLHDLHGGNPEIYYTYFLARETDKEVRDEGCALLHNRDSVWDILIGARV